MKPAVSPDSIVLKLWRNVFHDGMFASRAISAAFSEAPELTPRQRGEIVTALHGMLSHARRLTHVLGAGHAGQKTSALSRLTAWQVLQQQLSVTVAAKRVPGVDWAAVKATDAALQAVSDSQRRVAVLHSLPDFLAEKLIAQYGGDAELLAEALGMQAPLVLRVNTLRTSRPEILGRMVKAGIKVRPTKFCKTGIVLERHADVYSLPQYAAGEIEIQDEGSQLVAELVAPPPRGLVIDYCAGAGGKTLALAALMSNRGRLVAADIHARRLDEFKRRARRAGVSNARAIVLGKAGQWPPEMRSLAGKADRVLVDVPCSGIGAFRRKPEMRWRLTADELRRMPDIQYNMACDAMKLCAPGGRLIYSTCTLLAEENECVVERLLLNDAFELVPPKEILGRAPASALTGANGRYLSLLPHVHGTDGFFAAVLRCKRKQT